MKKAAWWAFTRSSKKLLGNKVRVRLIPSRV